MRAVVLEEHGGPEVLTVREVPDPVPAPEEVLVEVVATALNRADLLQRMGLYPGPPTDHEIPGLEFAGRVVAIGDRVRGRNVGDPVMGVVAGGAYAERLVTHERETLAVPGNVALADAAAIPEVWSTAYDALVIQAGLTAGRVALVHAGASGVGTASIQIAKAIGARIVVTTSTGKVEACRSLGADLVVDYTEEDFVEAVGSFTGGAGADVILDVVGGEYLPRNVAALAAKGTLIQVGTMGGKPVPFDVGSLMFKRARVIGTVLRARPVEEKIALARRIEAELVPLFADGTLHPIIDIRLGLDHIVAAHRHMEANANIGKIVIDV